MDGAHRVAGNGDSRARDRSAARQGQAAYTPRPMRVFIATWDAAGGFPPERTIIRGLVARGHDVHVAAHTSVRGRAEASGATFHVLPNVADYDASRPITP